MDFFLCFVPFFIISLGFSKVGWDQVTWRSELSSLQCCWSWEQRSCRCQSFLFFPLLKMWCGPIFVTLCLKTMAERNNGISWVERAAGHDTGHPIQLLALHRTPHEFLHVPERTLNQNYSKVLWCGDYLGFSEEEWLSWAIQVASGNFLLVILFSTS